MSPSAVESLDIVSFSFFLKQSLMGETPRPRCFAFPSALCRLRLNRITCSYADQKSLAIAQGQVIEDYPDDKYGASCLIAGFTTGDRLLHIQCSYPSRPLIKIITIYQPNSKRWNNTFTQRK